MYTEWDTNYITRVSCYLCINNNNNSRQITPTKLFGITYNIIVKKYSGYRFELEFIIKLILEGLFIIVNRKQTKNAKIEENNSVDS